MAPSAPLPLPPPPPLAAFLEGEEAVPVLNGHCPADGVCLALQPKLPGKSSLKTHSMFGGPPQQQLDQAASRHSQRFPADDALDSKMDKDPKEGEPNSGNGTGADVIDSGADCISCKRKDIRVKWNDSHGKDLAEVWEFEPSDTGDSDDEESDSESSQSCTCVIQ